MSDNLSTLNFTTQTVTERNSGAACLPLRAGYEAHRQEEQELTEIAEAQWEGVSSMTS